MGARAGCVIKKMDPPSPNIPKYLDPPERIFQISAEIFGPPMKLLFPPLKFMQFFTEGCLYYFIIVIKAVQFRNMLFNITITTKPL